jgi:5,5'-dehydrodivanillate O-demethylase
VLSEAKHRLLAQMGPGTSIGNLMRRCWQPRAVVRERDNTARTSVRLMGDALVPSKALRGTHGLVNRHCPHHRPELSYGYVSECWLRGIYYDWLSSENGRGAHCEHV